MTKENNLNIRWLALMAWRDSRKNRSRLLLFISSIVLGIAALVAIYSLGDNVRKDIDAQAATLIGADLQVSSNKIVSDSVQQILQQLGEDRSQERSFASMIFFPKNKGTRLVQVRAIEGKYPYYGTLETLPQQAAQTFRTSRAALVDKTLLLQYNARPGDSIRIGNVSFVIEGSLLKAPGQTGLSTSVAPSVYIPLQWLEQTGLVQKGSRINYRYFFKLKPAENIEKIVQRLEPILEKEGLYYETIETQKEETGRSFADISSFLSLVGFIALLLGCIGVASSIHVYIKEKVNTIAILRCLGAKAKQAFAIYLLQILFFGLIGSLGGALLGIIIQQFLPLILKDFVAVNITASLSWPAILQGILLGIIISVLFAMLPLISLRKISPLNTLRISDSNAGKRDLHKWLVYLSILLFVLAFSYLQLRDWKESIFFTLGVLAAFLLLVGIALLVMWAVRKFFPINWNYLWRQALANLYRPNNQTVILVVCIGLGTAFICTLISVQAILLNRVTVSASGNQPNMVLFDIQTQQKEAVAMLATQHKLPLIQQVPIVNMRLESWNGKSITAITAEDSAISRRVLTREYRVTYRDSLTRSEKIVDGKWHGNVAADGTIYISVEEGWAKRQQVQMGDTMTFNVQGAMIPTIVGSFREVDWNRIQTNFLIVFPKGVLEAAPQFHVLLTRVESDAASARFQQAMVQRFANVSIIDLGLVLKTLDEILQKIAFVIRFMAGFSIVTGLIVLVASVLTSKFQRIQESVLLRTLGASRRQILGITALEYFFLGSIASFTGIMLSLVGTWALAKYSFKAEMYIQPVSLFIVLVAISVLIMVIGLLNIRGILNKAPLEVLRKEG